MLVREGDPDGNPWGIQFSTMFHMTNDSGLFRTASELEALGAQLEGNVWRKGDEAWLPLYEGKMIHQYNHRDGDYSKYILKPGKEVRSLPGLSESELANPNQLAFPRYWVNATHVYEALGTKVSWLIGFRKSTNVTTNRRTLIVSALPVAAVGDKLPLLLLNEDASTKMSLIALLNSFAADYVARQKIGGADMSHFVLKQVAVPSPGMLLEPVSWSAGLTIKDWIARRAFELLYTAVDMTGIAKELNYDGLPIIWDPDRRRQLRAELDAACFLLYGLNREEVGYIMDTFPIVQRKDEAAFGEYLTKRLILEKFDELLILQDEQVID